jgi:hypothetical protein
MRSTPHVTGEAIFFLSSQQQLEQYSLSNHNSPLFQIINYFSKFKYIDFNMHLDIHYV